MLNWETKIEEKLDRISDKIETVNVVLSRQEANIQEHIRRTAIAEEALLVLKEELKPVQRHVFRVEGVAKALGILGIVAAVTTVAIQLIQLIQNQ